jgi:non-specific serine/threonine protein kinase
LLLLLDNAEHLLAACATFVATVLQRCPSVRILLTSREASRIDGEVAYPVTPLSLPAMGTLASLEVLAQSEAVQLFVNRAVATLPSFRLTEQNAQAVVQICRRVDGIPLAIELAAARVRALSVEQIASRLDDQVRLLSDGGRPGLPRHQTLRATMDWSHSLLTRPEEILFRRFAAFAGGFTLEAAEFVVTGTDLEPASVLDHLAGLVYKSLVEVDERGAEVRYRLLEPVRQYALSKLKEVMEEPAVRARHRDFFMALAEHAHAGLVSQERVSWQSRVEAEHDNIRAALLWSIGASEFEEAFRLGASMARFWARHGYLEEGWKWLRELRKHESAVSPVARARLLVGMALLTFEIGDQVEAMAVENALNVFRELGDRDEVEASLRLLGMIENERGEFDRATAVLDEAVALASQSGDSIREAEALRQRGYVEVRRGDYGRGIPYLQRSLELLGQTGAHRSIGFALGHLAQAYLYQGHAELAAAMLREALTYVETARQSTATAYFRNLLALALLWLEDFHAAEAAYRGNLAYSDEMGHRWAAAQALIGFGAVGIQKGNLQFAVRLLAAAHTFLTATVYKLPVAEEAYVQRLLSRLRALLDPTEFELGWAAGSAFTLKQAIQYATSQLSLTEGS